MVADAASWAPGPEVTTLNGRQPGETLTSFYKVHENYTTADDGSARPGLQLARLPPRAPE